MTPFIMMVLGVFLSAVTLFCSKVAMMDPGQGVYLFMFLRFFIAFSLMALVMVVQKKGVTQHELKGGLVLAVLIFIMLDLSMRALRTINSGTSSFIASFAVVVVFIMDFVRKKQRPAGFDVLMIFLAVAGMLLVTLAGGAVTLNKPLVYTFISTVFWAVHIVVVGQYAKTTDPYALNFVQSGAVSLMALGASAVSGEGLTLPVDLKSWGLILCTGLFGSCLLFVLQMYAQPKLGDLQVSMLYLLRPVFASFLSYVFLAEYFNNCFYLGAALILIALYGINVQMMQATSAMAQDNKIAEGDKNVARSALAE